MPAPFPAFAGVTAPLGRTRTNAVASCTGALSVVCADAPSPAVKLGVATDLIGMRGPPFARTRQKPSSVSITVSMVIVLAAMVWLLIRTGGLKTGHAIAAVLLGFYLRGSSLAPSISGVVQSVVEAISEIRI